MSQADELLDSLTEEQMAMYGVNPIEESHIIINSDRTIAVPDELKHIAVQGEHNIETITFDCPRHWDGHDLSQMSMRIVYQRADGHREPYPVENLRVDDTDTSMIHFDWTISGNVTAVKGNISFMVCAKIADVEGVTEREWHSQVNQDLIVDEGLECSGDEIVEQNPDILESILSRLDIIESTGGVTDEQVTSAVNAYLEANPVEVVEDALIYDLPQQCAIPELQWDMLVQDDLTVTRAKAAVVMSGYRRVWVYGENLDGNNADLPRFPPYSTTGVLAIKYRACWMNGNAPSGILLDGTGVVAQLGSEYIDYNGETKTFPGGCGLPSAIMADSTGMAYFSSAESGATTINGTKQRLIPCCATFNVGAFSDVVFETPRELTLSIDGETGAFDMSRLGYDNWYTYYTTMAPTYHGSTFHWCQPVTDGFVYLTSTDGINWEYKFTVKTPYQPRYEVAVACGIGQWKSRNLAVVRTARGYLLLMMFNPSDGTVYAQCKIPDVGSRPMVYRGKQFMLLLHTLHTTRNEMEALQVLLTDSDEFVVYRWFTIFGNATWYPMLENNPHNVNATFRDLVISGNNGGLTSGRGMSTIRFKADSTKPVCVLDCVLDDPANKGYTLPVATEDTLGGVKPVAKTSAMTKPVGVGDDGTLYTEPDTQSASAINDMAIVYDATLEEASNSFGDAASVDVSAYHDLVVLLTVVGDSTASGNAQINLGTNTIWARSVATTGTTRTLIAQMSKTALGWVGFANTTNSTDLSDGATSSAQNQGSIELMNLAGVINTIGAKYQSASSLFGAGSRLTLMGR